MSSARELPEREHPRRHVSGAGNTASELTRDGMCFGGVDMTKHLADAGMPTLIASPEASVLAVGETVPRAPKLVKTEKPSPA